MNRAGRWVADRDCDRPIDYSTWQRGWIARAAAWVRWALGGFQ